MSGVWARWGVWCDVPGVFDVYRPTPELSSRVVSRLSSADVRFSVSEALEDDDGFPKAFFTFLKYLYNHRCARLRESLPAPAQKGDRTPKK